MKDDLSTETTIKRYLLGDLPEEARVHIEERAFEDREYRSALEDAENDLVDEYVRGGLSDRERQQFESLFFNSDERRRKVKFASGLAIVAKEFPDRAAADD